jgi:hypothetical protein
MPTQLSFLVDAAALADDPALPYLVSFADVEGLEVEHHITITDPPAQEPYAAVGALGTRFVAVAPLHQFRRFAAEIAARPSCLFSAEPIERALAFSHLASLLKADAVVSPTRPAFGPQDAGLFSKPLVTVQEALAVIGAYVRQREEVPLGGSPPLVQERTEVYPLTAKVIVPNGQEWWSSCVRYAGPDRDDVLGHGEAVFKRIGRSLMRYTTLTPLY